MDETARIVVVGNAPDPTDRGASIDGADRVVRFNNSHGFGTVTGSRIDDLYLVNCGGQMREWLDDEAFLERAHVSAASRIVLPIAPETADPMAIVDSDGVNHAREARRLFETSGRRLEVLPATAFFEACAALGHADPGDAPPPSTGFLAIHHLISTVPDASIELTGFEFAGWSGHAWDAERRWVEAQIAAGHLHWL